MSRIFKTVCFFLICGLISSCGDCVQRANGVVLDSATKRPIVNVAVYKGGNAPILTDSVGKFEARGISGGLTGCPVLVLNFEKDGYLFKTVAMDKDNIVYLTKDNTSK